MLRILSPILVAWELNAQTPLAIINTSGNESAFALMQEFALYRFVAKHTATACTVGVPTFLFLCIILVMVSTNFGFLRGESLK